MNNNPEIVNLLLLVSNMCARHLSDALHEHPEDEELQAEFAELSAAYEAVCFIYTETQNEHNKAASIPLEIQEFIETQYPELCPVSIELHNEEPVQYLIRTTKPMTYAIADKLDNRFPDINIVLKSSPI